MAKGLIVKALSGYYYVLPEGQAPGTEALVQCRARGIFKKHKVSPLVGDRVDFSLTENGEGTVDAIGERTSELIRPPIANTELAVLVFSVQEPAFNDQLLDKFLVHIEKAGLDTVIVLTKTDLKPEDTEWVSRIEPYRRMGYDIFITSSKQMEGIDAVRARLSGTVSVFAGQSGVGKSSLVNALLPGLKLATDEISMRLGRGKHTTRHVELIPLNGGWVADTPGFSQLDFLELEAEELSDCFRDLHTYAPACRFRGCLHHKEPGCAVRAAVEQGELASWRYEHYLQFLTEIKERKRRY
ncbi:ribosome small subunit-dependent GTPase A [Gorillibacterium timonense]|uniref:ribosome small subunit-dependent GTPase A n=1 Tax=Gorillibacterium timonense TaxID=1689269 RepID=UPI00071CDE82|nr:ribosome small subunit-dependent GTPase A [Gorillibacterium timonense]